jgi:uncharacterized damage-inducible protein DinB
MMSKIDIHQGMTVAQVFYTEWKRYQDGVKQAIVPLSAEQLRLRAAPDLRTIGENVAHIVATRVGWFMNYMGENDPQVAPLETWDHSDKPQPERSAAELAAGMDASWKFMQDRFDRWTPADMTHTFPHDDPEWRDTHVTSRSWVVWHVLEHDLHHGGEVSLTLGIHGLQAPQL